MKKIRLVWQTKQNTCGPACLAMLTGSTEEKMLEILGKRFRDGTQPKHMKWALNGLGIETADRWQKDGLWQFDKKALLRVAYAEVTRVRTDIFCHYIVWANKKYYDPSWGILNELMHWSTGNCWQKVHSYLPIYD